MTKILVLGIGNPILSDDSVGLKVAEKIKDRIAGIEVKETSNAGLSLLEEIAGFEKLVLIDSIRTGNKAPGETWKIDLAGLGESGIYSSSHEIGVRGAFELGRRLGYPLPRTVRIYAIEIEDNTTFSEECTEEVAGAIPGIVQRIIEEENLENVAPGGATRQEM